MSVCDNEAYERCLIGGADFDQVDDVITFGVEETEMEVLILIRDNAALEEVEEFNIMIEAVEGDFPVAVVDSMATVTITDNDCNSSIPSTCTCLVLTHTHTHTHTHTTVVVLGFTEMDHVTNEVAISQVGVVVRVELLHGQLERSIAVWVNSTQDSTATPDQGQV